MIESSFNKAAGVILSGVTLSDQKNFSRKKLCKTAF